MGKFDLNNMKKQRQAQEVEGNVPEALEQSYTSVWGKDKEQVEFITLDRIMPFSDNKGRSQPFSISREKVEQIKASAADIGIITPLIVRKYNNDYQIISGHHRYEAAKQLGKLTVPCVVRTIEDEEAVKYVTESNIQRSKLLPTEYAAIYARYMDIRKDIDMTAEEIANKFGISKKSLYRYINILDLSEELQELIDHDKLHTDTAEIFVNFTKENQHVVFEFVQKSGKTVNRALAKRMQDVVSTKDGTVSLDDFTALLAAPTPTGMSKVFKGFSKKYGVDYSDEEWEDLIDTLLAKHFENNEG